MLSILSRISMVEIFMQVQQVWDNLNLMTKHRYEREGDEYSKHNFDWMASMLLKDRIDTNHMNGNAPVKDATDMKIGDFVPTDSEKDYVIKSVFSDGGYPELQTQAFPVNSLILLAQFWPQFKAESLKLPHEVTEALDVYTKAFQTLKGNRTLVWKPQLGFTNIDLEIGDKKINLTVSSIHAATIYSFQEAAEWTARSWPPVPRCPSPPCAGRSPSGSPRALQGVLVENTPDTFSLVELRAFLDTKVRQHKLAFSGGHYRLPK